MAQRLASLLKGSSCSTLCFPASSASSTLSSNSILPNEELLLEDGKTQTDLTALFSPDLSSSLRYLLAVLSTPTPNPKYILRVATFLLNPPRPTPSPTSSPQVRKKRPESTRAVVALLFGIHSSLSRPHSHEEDGKDLEALSQCLVDIFVKGGGKSPDLEEEIVVAVLGRTKGASLTEGSRSTWELSRAVTEELDSRMMELQQSEDDSVVQEEIRVRTRINSLYVLSILSSSASSPSNQTASTSKSLSASESLFVRCIQLGLSISLVGASSSSSSSDLHSSHASSLVWKARKRLELSGHASLAVLGLPPGGGSYERWDGGAVERARLAEQARRDKMVAGEEKGAFRGGVRLNLLSDGSAVLCSEGGDLLDAPRRLKGKKIVATRRGTFSRSNVSSRSSSGPPTPTEELTSLRYADCPFPHHSHVPLSLSSPIQAHSTTSLPSLNGKPSIHLLRFTSSPRRATSSLPPYHRTDPPLPPPETLKSPTPVPLPNLLNQNGIFSPAQASIEPLPPVDEGVETDSIYERGSKLLQRSVSRLALSFIFNHADPHPTPSPVAMATALSSASNSSPPRPSSSTKTRGRPASVRIPSHGQRSSSSGSSTTAATSPTSPILIHKVPKIAFQPSTFRYDCFKGNQDSTTGASVWRPSSSPRGDRMRVLSGARRGKKEN